MERWIRESFTSESLLLTKTSCPAVMDFRAVIIFLYLLNAQAACGIVRNKRGAVNATIQLLQEEINVTLEFLVTPGLLPDIPCQPLNIPGLVVSEQQPLTAHNLSSFGCYMQKMSKRTTELSSRLLNITQYIWAVSNQTAHQDCRLPALKQDMDDYIFVKCLLKLLNQLLSKTMF